MNVKQVFKGILRKWGNDILLQRRTNTSNSINKEYSNKLERHTVRSRYPGSPVGVAQEQIEGVLHNADMIYYFKHDANPMEGDRIYENYERNNNDVRVFIVSYAIPMRGRGGSIDFWTVGATREVIE
jgi:hypothetical protein